MTLLILDHYRLFTVISTLTIFAGMLAFMEWGARWARRSVKEGEVRGVGAIEGALFALFGLLIAFTFSGAAERLRERGSLSINESDAVGTAFLRLDLLAEPDRPRLKGLLRDYLAARLDEYSHFGSAAEHEESRGRTAAARARLWAELVPAIGRAPFPQTSPLILGPVNETFDIADRREAFRHLHPPLWIYVMLILVGFASAALAGFSLDDASRKHWLHRLCFATATALVLFVTMNMEYPRLGFIDISGQNRPLQQALEEMTRDLGTPPGK
jgi:hypothetical protein